MTHEIDITRPFIAIRKDAKGNFMQPTLGEYICNPLSEDLFDVRVELGGWYSAEEIGVITSVPKELPAFDVPSGHAVRYTISTEDEFNEMDVHWTVRYRTESEGETSVPFGSYKRLEDAQFMTDVPILGGRGRVIPRTMPSAESRPFESQRVVNYESGDRRD